MYMKKEETIKLLLVFIIIGILFFNFSLPKISENISKGEIFFSPILEAVGERSLDLAEGNEVELTGNLEHPYLLFNKNEVEEIRAKSRGEISNEFGFDYVDALDYLNLKSEEYLMPYEYNKEIPCLNEEGTSMQYIYTFSSITPPRHEECVYPPWTLIAGNIRKRLIGLSFTGLITEEQTYIEGAKSMMLDLSNWDYWKDPDDGYTSFSNLDTAYITYGVSVGYDLLYDYLTEEERVIIRGALTEKGISPIYQTFGQSQKTFQDAPNYFMARTGAMGFASLSILGESNFANTIWLPKTINNIETILDGQGTDGGLYEGYGYGSFIGYIFNVINAFGNMDHPVYESFSNNEFLNKFPDFVMTSTAPFEQFPEFGDSSDVKISWFLGSLLYYSRNNHVKQNEILGYLDNFNSLPRYEYPAFWLLDETDEIGLSPVSSKKFDESGLVILRKDWEENDPFLAFKSSPDMDIHHSHYDANSFVLGYEKWLLTDPGYVPYVPSSLREYGISTKAHNSILVDGQGQTFTTGGYIDDFYTSEDYDYVVGEAAPTYDPSLGLNSFKRHILFLKQDPEFFIIYDELDANTPKTYTLLFHSKEDISPYDSLSQNYDDFQISDFSGGLRVKIFSSADLNSEKITNPGDYWEYDKEYVAATIAQTEQPRKEYFLSIIYPSSKEVNFYNGPYIMENQDFILLYPAVDVVVSPDYLLFNPEKIQKTIDITEKIRIHSNALICVLKAGEVISYNGECEVEYYCGNGILEGGEECDDKNAFDYDGCSLNCEIEEDWVCSGEPSVCKAICGDGIIKGGEECDDFNTQKNDGCNEECIVEGEAVCIGEPSKCLVPSQITSDFSSQYVPVIYENKIVWRDYRNDNHDIYMCDLNLNGQNGGCLANDEKTQITSDFNTQSYPVTYENKIVWEDYRSGASDIYMCDLNLNGQNGGCLANDEKTQITSDFNTQSYPFIYENKIVWCDVRNNNYDIYMCDLNLNGQNGGCLANDEKTQITSDFNTQYSPVIYENKIVWQDYRNNNPDIYMCDLNLNGQDGGCLANDEKTQITTNFAVQYVPVIYENKIVWQDSRNGAYDIYLLAPRFKLKCVPGQKIGDVNNDGQITQIDADFLIRALYGDLGLPEDICCADVDFSGKIDISDITKIGSMASGSVSSDLGYCHACSADVLEGECSGYDYCYNGELVDYRCDKCGCIPGHVCIIDVISVVVFQGMFVKKMVLDMSVKKIQM